MRLDPSIIRQQIDNLLQAFPELQEDETLRSDMLEGSTDLFEFLRELERKRQEAVAMKEALASNIETLKSRSARFERRDEGIRSLMFKLLEWAKQRKAELPEATLSIRAGVPRVIITDEKKIPKAFQRITIEPNKALIKEALSGGKKVAGAELSNAPETLSIRVQ